MNRLLETSCFCSKLPEKKHGEDFFLPPTFDSNLDIVCAIADGVSNSDGAMLASRLAIEEVRKLLNSGCFTVEEAFKKSKVEIDKLDFKTATTLTILHVKRDRVIIGHVGDCRVYYLMKNKLIQVTKDHTRYQELLDSGQHKLRNLRNHKERLSAILNSALSNTSEVNFDIIEIPISKIIINGLFNITLMSDGAYKHWDARPMFSEKTMSSPAAFSSSLKKRIERNIVDDYTFISMKFGIEEYLSSN